MKRLHIRVFGDVQGVFFRAGVQSEGRKLGLYGWVRNLSDGSVELMAEGEDDALKKLLDWCGHGPAGASVSQVESAWLEYRNEFNSFEVRY